MVLSLFVLANFAKADRILIYHGYQIGNTNEGPAQTSHLYWLFDLDTSELNYVLYSGTATGKVFTTGTATSFVYEPVTTSSNSTETYFQYGSSDLSASFAINFGTFSGNNEAHFDLGGTFTGVVPAIMSFNSYNLTGNGTTGSDEADIAIGEYDLDSTLTRESNGSSDNLSTATTAVTNFLGQQGYTRQ